MFNNFFPENYDIDEIIWKILYSQIGHRWRYGAFALRSG